MNSENGFKNVVIPSKLVFLKNASIILGMLKKMRGHIYEYVLKKNMAIGRKLKSNFWGVLGFSEDLVTFMY